MVHLSLGLPKKQSLVTHSSMELELVAGSFASTKGIWLLRLVEDFQHNFCPIPIYINNYSALTFNTSNVNHSRTKHIDIHYHYMHKQVTLGNIALHHIPGIENPVDIFTKALGTTKHAQLLEILGVRHAWGGVLQKYGHTGLWQYSLLQKYSHAGLRQYRKRNLRWCLQRWRMRGAALEEISNTSLWAHTHLDNLDTLSCC